MKRSQAKDAHYLFSGLADNKSGVALGATSAKGKLAYLALFSNFSSEKVEKS